MSFVRLARLAAAALAVAAASPAMACGICVEDKVAAAYDHAVVMQALDQGKVVVFAEVKGPGPAASRVAAARKAAARVPGIERRSVRVAESPAALSFMLDARGRTPAQVLAMVERAAAVPGLELVMLKVMR